MMWKSLVSIPGIEYSLSLSLSKTSCLSPSIPAGKAGPQRNQDGVNWIVQAFLWKAQDCSTTAEVLLPAPEASSSRDMP